LPWCLERQLAEPAGADQVRVTETYLGSEDPSWTRR
jgi:hypothetical protein